METASTENPPATTRGLARDASIIALGNAASRVLGFFREQVKANLFGAGPQVDALNLALAIPIQVYDLVTGGMVNSALVPAFSEYTPAERRTELWRLASLVLTLTTLIVSFIILILFGFAPQVVAAFAWISALNGRTVPAPTLEAAAQLLRVTLPAVVFLSLSGVLTGLLYALKRFTLPAFVGAVFNASMVLMALIFSVQWGVLAMAWGLMTGALLQVILQFPALRDAALWPALNLRHPGLRRILKAYVPITISMFIAQLSNYFGLSVAFGYERGLSWMGYATNLYQFPLGLVGVAVSSAILPTLAQQVTAPKEFRATLAQGLNLVMALIVPATVGLFVLAQPVIALAFQHGEFTARDTVETAHVLQVLVLGLSFAALDLMLINAFYALGDTLTPSSVGVFSVVVYVAVALGLQPMLGFFSLILADAVKHLSHAVVSGFLLARRLGGFGGAGVWQTSAKVLLAAGLMGLGAAGALALTALLPLPTGWLAHLVQAAFPAGVGVLLYFALAWWLKISEVRSALASVRRRFFSR